MRYLGVDVGSGVAIVLPVLSIYVCDDKRGRWLTACCSAWRLEIAVGL